MSKYYVDKFLYTTDRDPVLLQEYKSEPAAYMERWEREIGPRLSDAETTSWTSFTPQERQALIDHDYVTLFELGAHFFLSLTIYHRHLQRRLRRQVRTAVVPTRIRREASALARKGIPVGDLLNREPYLTSAGPNLGSAQTDFILRSQQ